MIRTQCSWLHKTNGSISNLGKLLGDYSKAASSQTLVAKGSSSIGDDLVDLVSARLITVSETEAGEALAEAKIKQMTGGDILKGRPLYGSWLEFSIIGKIFLPETMLATSIRFILNSNRNLARASVRKNLPSPKNPDNRHLPLMSFLSL